MASAAAFEIAVLPQRRDGIGHHLSVTDRGHDSNRSLQRQLMHQRRREVVEQVSVVDADNRVLRGVNRLAGGGQAGDRITRAAGPTRCAKTPNGIDRADSVPATQCTGVVIDWVTARARVVLPTPASPNSTMPEKSFPPAKAERIAPNSSSRRTIGQDRVSTSTDSTANPERDPD